MDWRGCELMNSFQLSVLVVATTAKLLTGCATPQAALDHANNGAALIGSLNTEVHNFRRVQSGIVQLRLESVRRQRARLATYEAAGGFDDRVLRAAGRDDLVRLYSSLKELSDSRAQDEVRLEATISDMDRLLGEILKPLPEQGKSLTQALESLAALGEERPFEARMKEASEFAKRIQESIEKNRGKIQEAGAATSTASAQPPLVQVAAQK
jgi:hypothetical protein